MKIKVTQEHIDQGERLDATRCPICHAIGLDRNPIVSMSGITIDSHGGTKISFDVPDVVKKFIRSFDYYEELMGPFEFDLVDEVQR